jgi:tyrosine-protein phosphatase SIW14
MRAFKNHRWIASLAALAVAAAPLAVARPQTPQPGSPAGRAANQSALLPAKHISLPGVDNFAEVTPTLYRGAQPSRQGFEQLKQLGVEIVVNLRGGGRQSQTEQRQVTALGMRYAPIPWSSFHRPENRDVAGFLELLRANPDQKVFVHCREGADRTGVMIAAFRITDEHWTPVQALEEMHAFHFHSLWFHSWKKYVEQLPLQLRADPSLRSLAPAAQPSSP